MMECASLNHDCAEGPDVALHRVSAMKQQRRASPRRSSDLGKGVNLHAIQHFSQAKVRNLAPPLSGQEYVRTFQIQMSDRLVVERQEASSNVLDDLLAPVQHLSLSIHSDRPETVSMISLCIYHGGDDAMTGCEVVVEKALATRMYADVRVATRTERTQSKLSPMHCNWDTSGSVFWAACCRRIYDSDLLYHWNSSESRMARYRVPPGRNSMHSNRPCGATLHISFQS